MYTNRRLRQHKRPFFDTTYTISDSISRPYQAQALGRLVLYLRVVPMRAFAIYNPRIPKRIQRTKKGFECTSSNVLDGWRPPDSEQAE